MGRTLLSDKCSDLSYPSTTKDANFSKMDGVPPGPWRTKCPPHTIRMLRVVPCRGERFRLPS